MADTTQIKYICTTLAKLNTIPVESGNLIFCEDKRCIYLDTATGRTAYEQIMCIPREDMRISMTRNLVSGFYFVLDTNVLWRLDDVTWIQVTNSPSETVIYGTLSSFPRPGVVGKIYATDKHLYHWDEDSQMYVDYCNTSLQWIVEPQE